MIVIIGAIEKRSTEPIYKKTKRLVVTTIAVAIVERSITIKAAIEKNYC